jgi:hypothetical protein
MMENISVLNNPNIDNDNIYKENFNSEYLTYVNPGSGHVDSGLTEEGIKNFFSYLKSFNLSLETDLLILTPNNHYYYDEHELKSVRTLMNLKKLNFIKDLDTFLQTLFHILPPNVNFTGCFSDSNTLKGNGFLSGLSTRFNNLLDFRTNHIMDKKDVSELLEKYGFKIVDITEMNGLTYFYSQSVRQPIEIRDNPANKS